MVIPLIIFSILATTHLASSYPISSPDANAAILKQELDVGSDGAYQYAYETSNGIAGQEQGQLKNIGTKEEAQIVQGQSQYYAPTGELISLQYVADENGFQPQGSHLPTPPPIPPAIVRALEYLASHPQQEE